jgi:WbqC-like protein family.
MERTSEYKQSFLPQETDFRDLIHPKKAPQPGFVAQPYYQVFEARHGFLPNLSIIDLLFNMGPESLLVLRDANK